MTSSTKKPKSRKASKAKSLSKPVSKPVKPVSKPKAVKQEIDLSQFRVHNTADAAGIHVQIIHNGNLIHTFKLSSAEYANWQRMPSPMQTAYVRSRTTDRAFGNNKELINMVVQATVNVINGMFANARAAQAQRNRVVL